MPAPTPEQRAAARVRPARSPVMFQSWRHPLFLHWRWDADTIQATLPPGLFVDTYDGDAYLGVVPFWMDAVRPRFCPPFPGLSWFLELNLRTYVHTADGTPGVWFYSLDCNNPVAVTLARTLFHLPYIHALQTGSRPDPKCNLLGYTSSDSADLSHFMSRRKAPSADAADNHFTYAPAAAPAPAAPGSLDYFLVERYVLFSHSARTRRLFSGRVWHPPYTVSPARITRAETSLFTDNGFPAPARPADHALTSPGVDVSIYPLRRLPA